MLSILAATTPDWLWDLAGPVLVGQAIVGIIGLIRLMAIQNRFLNTDFPAAMKDVNDGLDTLHRDLKDLEGRFNVSFVDLQLLKDRQQSLANRVDKIESRNSTLDDTAAGRRPPRRT